MKDQKLFRPGENCWTVAHCDRLSFIVEGANYFEFLYRTLLNAKQQFLIVSWDIDSQIRLIRPASDTQQDESFIHNGKSYSTRLGNFLTDVLDANPTLTGHVLNWDYYLILLHAREKFPTLKFQWGGHDRLNFYQDNTIPMWGCHHQKIVVVDDMVGFCGGLDLTRNRWDTSAHDPNNKIRIDIGGQVPRPHHDVQLAVSGEVAKALGALVRTRWHDAKGESLEAPSKPQIPLEQLWPEQLPVDMENVTVAISRTMPKNPSKDKPGIFEIEALYIDSIQSAEEYIYFENQYLTVETIAQSLGERLAQAQGPEVLIVMPAKTDGWVAQNTMDIRRMDIIGQLREKDVHNRLRIYYPRIDKDNEKPLNVHSKVMIIDDVFVRVGSSNLCNRSMKIDSECDLSVYEPDRPDVKEAIHRFRDRLIAEHLGIVQEDFNKLTAQFSLVKAVDLALEAHGNQVRTLVPLESLLHADERPLPGEAQFFDPKEPIDSKRLAKSLTETLTVESAARRLPIGWIIALVVCLALSFIWRFTPLQQWIDAKALIGYLEAISQLRFAPVVASVTILVASLMMIPITLLAAITATVFGVWQGFLIIFPVAIISAAIAYGVGGRLGKKKLSQIGGSKIERVNRALSKHGVLAMTTIRLVPMAPFTVVNLVAGTSHINLRDFLLGTLLGMGPGLIAVMILVEQFKIGFSSAKMDHVIFSIAAVGTLMIGLYYVGNLLRKRFISKK